MIIERLARPKRLAEKKVSDHQMYRMPGAAKLANMMEPHPECAETLDNLWQTAYEEPKPQPRSFVNRALRQHLDTLTSLAAGTDTKEEPTTRRGRSRKPGDKELQRSASDDPSRTYYGSGEGRPETPERGEEGGRGREAEGQGIWRRRRSRGDGIGEDAGLDLFSDDRGNAAQNSLELERGGVSSDRDGIHGIKEQVGARKGRGRSLKGTLLQDSPLQAACVEACDQALSVGETTRIGDTAGVVYPRVRQGRRKGNGQRSHRAPGTGRSCSSEAEGRVWSDELETPGEMPPRAESLEMERGGDVDVKEGEKELEGGEKELEGGTDRKRASRKKGASKRKVGGFSRVGSGGSKGR